MFTKIDKRILIAAVSFLVLLLLLGIALYGYMLKLNASQTNAPASKIQSPADKTVSQDSSTPQENKPNVELKNGGVEAQGTGVSGITICSDKCGDGVCQTTDLKCDNGKLNC